MAAGSRRAGYVPFALGGAALAIGLGLAAWGSFAGSGETNEAAPTSATASSVTPDLEASGGSAAGDAAEDAPPYAPDLGGEDIGRSLTPGGASAHGLAVLGERVVWIETEGARVASVPLAGGEVIVLSSVDDEDRYGGGFAAGVDGLFWSVGDVGGAPAPIYFVRTEDLALTGPTLAPLATAGSVDDLALADDLFFTDGSRLVKVDDEEQTLIAERAGRVVAMAGCAGALWWLEAPLSGRGEHALMTLDEGKVTQRTTLDEAERGPMGCWSRRVVWAEDRADGTHRIARLDGSSTATVAATGTVTGLASADGALVWTEVHGEGAEAVSLIRRLHDREPERLGRDRGTATALAVAGERVIWASDDGIHVHP